MSAWAEVRERDRPNVHIYPLEDEIEHRADEHCVCRPKWTAGWSYQLESVVWAFIHSRLA